MMQKILVGLTMFMLCSFIPPVYGEGREPDWITLNEVLERALDDSPTVRTIEAHAAGQRAVAIQSATIENPVLDGEIRVPSSSDGARGSDEVALSLSQPLRVSDFGARLRVRRVMDSLVAAEEKIEVLAFRQRVAFAYAKAWAITQRERALSSYLNTTDRIQRSIERAAAGGLLSTGEGLLFKAEAAKARLELGALASDRRRARAALNKLVGSAVEGELSRPPLPETPTRDGLLSRSSSLPAEKRAALALELAREQMRAAELDAAPRFAPRMVYERTNDATDLFGVGISIELPISNRNQGARLARSAEARAAERSVRYYEGEEFADEVEALLDTIKATKALLDGYEGEIIPTLRRGVAVEEEQFAAGEGTPGRVWQVLRELSFAEAEVVDHWLELHRDYSELTTLTGAIF